MKTILEKHFMLRNSTQNHHLTEHTILMIQKSKNSKIITIPPL
jgi:hypothetical protein